MQGEEVEGRTDCDAVCEWKENISESSSEPCEDTDTHSRVSHEELLQQVSTEKNQILLGFAVVMFGAPLSPDWAVRAGESYFKF